MIQIILSYVITQFSHHYNKHITFLTKHATVFPQQLTGGRKVGSLPRENTFHEDEVEADAQRLRNRRSYLVLPMVGPTGTGKTTSIPPMYL